MTTAGAAAPVFRTRETIQIGDKGTFTKCVTSDDIFKFADASGDRNPLHIDEAYAQKTTFGQRIAHGILTAGIISSVLASDLPGVGCIFVELHIKFLKPVFIGDVVTANATVMEIINPRRIRLLVACVNQNGEDVALGNAIVVPPKETKVIV